MVAVAGHLQGAFCDDFCCLLVAVAALGEALLLGAGQAGAGLGDARLEALVPDRLVEFLDEGGVHLALDLREGNGARSYGVRRCVWGRGGAEWGRGGAGVGRDMSPLREHAGRRGWGKRGKRGKRGREGRGRT